MFLFRGYWQCACSEVIGSVLVQRLVVGSLTRMTAAESFFSLASYNGNHCLQRCLANFLWLSRLQDLFLIYFFTSLIFGGRLSCLPSGRQ